MLPICIAAVAAPVLIPYDPQRSDVASKLRPPSREHPLGTDEFGRDLLSRVVYGSRISLQVSFASAMAAAVFGVILGLVAGYHRATDEVISRVMDGLVNFPGIILGIMVMAALGPAMGNVILALTILYVPRIFRVVRASVLEIMSLPFVEATRALGSSDVRILVRHILPHTTSPLIVQVTFALAWAILAEASLSFLGLGTPPPTPTWGSIISDGREFFGSSPWIMFFPGATISACVIGLNLLGDGLRDALDPRFPAAQQRRAEKSLQ